MAHNTHFPGPFSSIAQGPFSEEHTAPALAFGLEDAKEHYKRTTGKDTLPHVMHDAFKTGGILEQVMYKHSREEDRQRHVIHAQLSETTYFYRLDGNLGLSLSESATLAGLTAATSPLRDANDRFLFETNSNIPADGTTTKKFIIQMRNMQTPFVKQWRWRPGLITRAEILFKTASALKQFVERNPEYTIGCEVFLLGCAHVSQGRYQPIFSIYVPKPMTW